MPLELEYYPYLINTQDCLYLINMQSILSKNAESATENPTSGTPSVQNLKKRECAFSTQLISKDTISHFDFAFWGAEPVARGRIGTAAAGLPHSHSHAIS